MEFLNEKLNKQEQINLMLERRLFEFQQINNSLKKEINILGAATTTLTNEKEELLAELDKKNSEVILLKKDLECKFKHIDELTRQISRSELKQEDLYDQIKAKLKEVTTLKMQLDRTNEVNSDLNRLYDSTLKDNKILQEELCSLNKENQQVNCEFVRLNAENIGMHEHMDQLRIEYSKQINACQEYDSKLSGINNGLQNFEKMYKNLQKENRDLAHDLLNARKLNASLEKNEEFLMKQITSKELDFNKLHNYLAERRSECHLKKPLVKTERLEDLIVSNRERDFQMQIITNEKESKIKFLKLKMITFEQKLAAQSKEICNLKGLLHDAHHENEHLRCQLKSERFCYEKRINEAYDYA